MAKTEIKVILMKNENNRDVLLFKLESGDRLIDLNSENQDSLEDLFSDLIKIALKTDVSFVLNADNYSDILFIDISTDYLKKLEKEIETIRLSIPEELKSSSD